MPLQKLPLNRPLPVGAITNQRTQLQDRRRTLQTISELSTSDGGLPDFVSSIGIENIRRLGYVNTPDVGRSNSKPVKRQSLPQCRSAPNIHLPRLSVKVTPAHRQDFQNSRVGQGHRPMPMTTDQAEGWNAKREQARSWHELAIAEANVQRCIPDQRSEVVISAVRSNPESYATPIRHPYRQQRPKKSQISGHRPPGQVERRVSLGSTSNNNNQHNVRLEVSERASTDSSSYQSRDSAIYRSRSGSSNTSYTSQEAPPLPSSATTDIKGYGAELILQNQNLVSFGESARSKNLNPNRSNRTLSLPTDGFKHMSAPHHRYVTDSDLRQLPKQQPSQISAQRARNQALAALTAANSHSRSNQRTQCSTSANSSVHQNRHASLTSHPPNSPAYRRSSSPHRNALRYNAQLEAQRLVTSPCQVYFNDTGRTTQHRNSDNIRRVSFEARTVPKRESLTQWKREREEAKANLHTNHKARMQERVKRANELEEEREKELVLMRKRAAKLETRNCFGSLFAVLRGKSR